MEPLHDTQSPQAMQTYQILVKRITDEAAPNVQQLKAAGLYRPLPDAQEAMTVQARDLKHARQLALVGVKMPFSGQEMQIWINGEHSLGNW